MNPVSRGDRSDDRWPLPTKRGIVTQRLQALFGASMWESWKTSHPIRWRWWAVLRQIERPLIWIQRRVGLAAEQPFTAPVIGFTRAEIEREVCGALASAIAAHGPITLATRASAAKRIVSALKARQRLLGDEATRGVQR